MQNPPESTTVDTKQPHNYLVPATKNYLFEAEKQRKLSFWRRYAYRFAPIKTALLSYIDELGFEIGRRTMSGKQFKDLMLIAAEECDWTIARRVVPAPRKRLTDDPNYRVCIQCGQTKPTKDFITIPTHAQMASYGWAKDVDYVAHEPPDGTRAVSLTREGMRRKRKTLHAKCAVCRNKNVSLRKSRSPTYKAFRVLVNKEQRNVNSMLGLHNKNKENDSAKFLYLHCRRRLLLRASYEARARARRGVKCPEHWKDLLSGAEQQELSDLYSRVTWVKRVPPLW
jgi:hypothetical protein